jgi:hypothetical protein
MQIYLQASIQFAQDWASCYFASIRNPACPLDSSAVTKQSLMPTLTFANYDAYSDAIQDASVRTTCLGRQYANWVLSYLSMNNLSVQWCKVGGPGAVEGTVKPGGTAIVLPAENTHAISANGRRFDDLSVMVLKPGEEFCFSAAKFTRWISVFVPNEILTDSNESVRASIGLRLK